jgi:hypothetical protein
LSEAGADDAAVGGFHFEEAWECGFEAESFGVGGVDAANEGLYEAIEGFAAEASADEAGEAFVGSCGLWGDEEFGEQSESAGDGEYGGFEECERLFGCHEHEAVGYWEWASFGKHE